MKGCGERVLYLDFDGVLHHENRFWSSPRCVFGGTTWIYAFSARAFAGWPPRAIPEHTNSAEHILAASIRVFMDGKTTFTEVAGARNRCNVSLKDGRKPFH